ncbi:MAG TPA: hypothetical protein VG276_04795 [Actinomycetes bacterium]|jgi:hypothetical protein|nr:hypothetical protein [Actinomycetes bacterium]
MMIVLLALLVGAVGGGAGMAMFAAHRIEQEATRQFNRGIEQGRWLHEVATARPVTDAERKRRVAALV